MREIYIGEMIKQKRMEQGLTQRQLCEGICEPVTMSRIESGSQIPSKSKLNALLQRLGLPDERYYALLYENEIKISNLQTEIISCNVLHNSKQGLQKIADLEKLIDEDDHIIKQFILRSRAILGKQVDREFIPYNADEKIELLFKAIRLTIPRFDINEINRWLYSVDEVKIINQIAMMYSVKNEYKTAAIIYSQLLKYLENRFEQAKKKDGTMSMVAYNYSRVLYMENDFEEALVTAFKGWKVCTEYGQYRYLPGTIAVMAECYYRLDNIQMSKQKYLEAYYTYKAINDTNNANKIKEQAKEFLNFEMGD